MNAIHIAGTKGKGSTAAFISSILNHFRTANVPQAPRKIGLYTSPHLRFVRERIQINGLPLSEDVFARYFFEIWDRLEHASRLGGEDPNAPGAKPLYFRYLTLMAFHTYLAEGVDCTVVECGIGGAHDSTNIVPRPAVTGITSLGIDHVAMLGDTIEQIAWHKAGIMKSRPPGDVSLKCFTTSMQSDAAKVVLQDVANETGTDLHFTDVNPDIASGKLPLGLSADFQHINASLALEISSSFLAQQNVDVNTPQSQECIHRGLASVSWPGRCDTRRDKIDDRITWYIDGGHTLESIELAGRWFGEQVQLKRAGARQDEARSGPTKKAKKVKTYLIFNQQTRDASALATALYNTLSSELHTSAPPLPSGPETGSTSHSHRSSPFNTVIFTTNAPYSSRPPPKATTTSPSTLPLPPQASNHVPSTRPMDDTQTHTQAQAQAQAQPNSVTKSNPDLMSSNVNPNHVSALTVQNSLAQTWRDLEMTSNSINATANGATSHIPDDPGNSDADVRVEVVRSVSDAVEMVRTKQDPNPVQDSEQISKQDCEADIEKLVLVTGSLHLVGAFLEVLEG